MQDAKMFDQQRVEAILKGIVQLNTDFGLWSIVIPVIFAAVVILLLLRSYKKPGITESRLVMGSLSVIYVYSGLTIFLGSPSMGSMISLIGAFAMWFVALLLALDAILNWTDVKMPENTCLKIVSIGLMATGILIYPLAEIILGFTWPRMVLFGAECPTTIFLIGLFIGCVPKVNRLLFCIVSLNAILTGFSVAMNGAPFDYLYGISGVAGVVVMIAYFKELFLEKSPIGSCATFE
jgi:hypothetical protein